MTSMWKNAVDPDVFPGFLTYAASSASATYPQCFCKTGLYHPGFVLSYVCLDSCQNAPPPSILQNSLRLISDYSSCYLCSLRNVFKVLTWLVSEIRFGFCQNPTQEKHGYCRTHHQHHILEYNFLCFLSNLPCLPRWPALVFLDLGTQLFNVSLDKRNSSSYLIVSLGPKLVGVLSTVYHWFCPHCLEVSTCLFSKCHCVSQGSN